MPLSFFSPKSTGKGAALYVSFNSKDAALYFKLISQTGWDNNTKQGSFKNGTIINVKFSLDEIGSFIHAIRTKKKANFYHSFGEENCSGSLSYYLIKAQKEGDTDKDGFGIQIKKGELTYQVGLTTGSAEKLMEYLRFALDHIFSAIYAADKKQAEEFARAKEETAAAPKKLAAKKLTKAAPEPEPEAEETEQEPEQEEASVDF